MNLDLGPDSDRLTSTLFDSQSVGWRSLRLQELRIEAHTEQVDLPRIEAQLIDLQTRGTRTVQSRHRAGWVSGQMGPGSLATTAPSEPSRLRWSSPTGDTHITQLRLLIPATVMNRVSEDVWGKGSKRIRPPDGLGFDDEVLRSVVTRLHRAAQAGVTDLYAATAAEFLAVHLLTAHGTAPPPPRPMRDDGRVTRVLDLLHSRLDSGVSLAKLSTEAGLSRFHLLRLFKEQTGRTPAQYHLDLRIQRAQRLLRTSDATVSDIAQQCGFLDHSHFARTFRRRVGCSPSAYRSNR